MKGARIVTVIATAAATVVLGAGAASAHETSGHHHSRPHVCANATLASGTYWHGLQVRGTCTIPDGAHVTVHNGVVLTRGSHLAAVTASTVNVSGGIVVEYGANLGLGCSLELTKPPFPGGPVICPGGVSHDTVRGNIVAFRPRTMNIDAVTVYGDVLSFGGGAPVPGKNSAACEEMPGALNFSVKDNTFHGGVAIVGWQGCWFGYIRNTQHGSTLLLGNHTASSDSTEIVSNTINGQLVCFGNAPWPQVGDSHGASNVATRGIYGQCRSLRPAPAGPPSAT